MQCKCHWCQPSSYHPYDDRLIEMKLLASWRPSKTKWVAKKLLSHVNGDDVQIPEVWFDLFKPGAWPLLRVVV
jgi:hypothetical protein